MASDAVNRVNDWWQAYLTGAERGCEQACHEILDTSKPIIAAEAIDNGTLLQSVEASDSVLRVGRFHWQARWSAEHAIYVNYGTGPGHYPDPRGQYMPPFDVILAWVKRNVRMVASIRVSSGVAELDDLFGEDEVRVDGGSVVKPKRKRGTRKVPDAEARRIARAIQMKIFLKGTEPVLFAERSRDEVMKRFDRILDENIDRELSEWQRRSSVGAA